MPTIYIQVGPGERIPVNTDCDSCPLRAECAQYISDVLGEAGVEPSALTKARLRGCPTGPVDNECGGQAIFAYMTAEALAVAAVAKLEQEE